MGARVSLVRSGLAGLGKFVFLTSAICVGMIIAISGPPTPSETASLGSAVGHAVRRFDSAALHFTFDLCDNVPVAAHAAGVCAKPTLAVARAEPPAREIEVSAVSETLSPSAREILPPDTIDQIARPAQTRSELLGEGRSAPRMLHGRSPRPLASRSGRGASVARARSPRAAAQRPTRAVAARLARRAAHAHPVRGRPAPPRRVHATPIAAPRSPRDASGGASHARAPSIPASALAPAPAPAPPGPAPEEHAAVPDEEHAPAPAQGDEDSQSNNPDEAPPGEDVKL